MTTLLFAHGYTQSLAESWNHEISSAAPKDVCAPSLYEVRILLAVLKHNEGPSYILALLKELEQPVTGNFNQFVMKQVASTKYQFDYHQQNPKKKKKFDSVSTPSVHTYKESSGMSCTCKTGCKNNRCGCKKKLSRCSDSCSCCGCQNKSGALLLPAGMSLCLLPELINPPALASS